MTWFVLVLLGLSLTSQMFWLSRNRLKPPDHHTLIQHNVHFRGCLTTSSCIHIPKSEEIYLQDKQTRTDILIQTGQYPSTKSHCDRCVFVCLFSLGAVRFIASHSFLCQSLSTRYSLSYHCETRPFFSRQIPVKQSSHYSLALVAFTSLKIKLTHSASLLFRCSYKSTLSHCERGEKRGTAEVFAGRRGSAKSPPDRPWGSNLLGRQVNQSSGSRLTGAHLQRCTWVEIENTAVTQCGVCMPLAWKGQRPTEADVHYASANQALHLWSANNHKDIIRNGPICQSAFHQPSGFLLGELLVLKV